MIKGSIFVIDKTTANMANLTAIIDALKAKNVQYELHETTTVGIQALAINISPARRSTWNWFKVYTEEDGKFYIMFDHSYSQITGSTKKSWSHGYKTIKSIEKKIGVSFY